MKHFLVAICALGTVGMIGCAAPADDITAVKAGSGLVQNPGGKPQDATQAAYAAEMQKTGQAMNAQRDRDSAAMEAAKKKAGGL